MVPPETRRCTSAAICSYTTARDIPAACSRRTCSWSSASREPTSACAGACGTRETRCLASSSKSGSESTWKEDAGAKRILYADLGVGEYWRLDPQEGKLFSPVLIGERLVDQDYQPIHVFRDESGNLRGHSKVLGLDICVRPDGETRLYDPASGQWLNSLQEEQVTRQQARSRPTASGSRKPPPARAARQAPSRSRRVTPAPTLTPHPPIP